MTRQEVLENIRYNERLVNQYVDSINKLNKKIAEFNIQIRQNNEHISQLNNQLRDINRQISDLGQVREKYYRVQNDFSDRRENRLSKFNANFSSIQQTGFIASYIRGMGELLSGREYWAAYEGLTTAISIINKEHNAVQTKADELCNAIKNAEKVVEMARREISSCQGKITKINSDLAYRRRRISYWRSQLSYAT